MIYKAYHDIWDQKLPGYQLRTSNFFWDVWIYSGLSSRVFSRADWIDFTSVLSNLWIYWVVRKQKFKIWTDWNIWGMLHPSAANVSLDFVRSMHKSFHGNTLIVRITYLSNLWTNSFQSFSFLNISGSMLLCWQICPYLATRHKHWKL